MPRRANCSPARAARWRTRWSPCRANRRTGWRSWRNERAGPRARTARPASAAGAGGAAARAGDRAAAGSDLGAQPAGGARRAGLCQPRPDDSEPRPACALLSDPALALGAGRRRHSGAGLPALAARTVAVRAAADPAERRHRAGEHRSRGDRGGRRRGDDGGAEAAPGRGAADPAGADGRHPHRRGVDDRRGDAVDHGGPAEPGRPDLRRPPDAELVAGADRLHRRRSARAGGGRAAGTGRARDRKAEAGAGVGQPGHAAGRDGAGARPGAAGGTRHRHHRRQGLFRAIYPRPADRAPAGSGGIPGPLPGRARLRGR
ncbi:conserved hypothetical protein, partial [Ricinus communis]